MRSPDPDDDLLAVDGHSVHSRELDEASARAVAEDGLILRTTVGSVVHGLSNPGTDDRDELGVCIEPPEYLLGFRRFEHFVYRTQPDGAPSGPGDLDLTVYGLHKFCRLALKGSPTVLLPLFVRVGEHLLVRSELGAELQALAPALVSRRTGRAFLGYLHARREALAAGDATARTRERSSAHGYDTKYAMHALRIGVQGLELLRTGRITLPVPEPDRSRLRAVRAGGVPLGEVVDGIDAIARDLERATDDTALPPEPDHAAADAFLVRAYRSTWDAVLR